MEGEAFAVKSPTIKTFNPFNPSLDAKLLKKAMKGLGTDESAIIAILGNRTNEQRQKISEVFHEEYGKKLVKELKSETSGSFQRLLVAIMTPVPLYYANELKAATAGLGTDEGAIVEILCTLSNKEIELVKTIYKEEHGNSLESDIKDDTSGQFKTLLTMICKANRDETDKLSEETAKQDAELLYEAGEKRPGTIEEVFVTIMGRKSYAQLRATFEEYHKKVGHSFEKAIKKEFSGDLKNALLAIVRRSNGKTAYLAERLKESMAGLGTSEKVLVRIIAARSEIDLKDVKIVYQSLNNCSLENDVKDETSGDFKKLLLELLQE